MTRSEGGGLLDLGDTQRNVELPAPNVDLVVLGRIDGGGDLVGLLARVGGKGTQIRLGILGSSLSKAYTRIRRAVEAEIRL